jgi:hypothetical protein
MPGAVVDQRARVVLEVTGDGVQIPPQSVLNSYPSLYRSRLPSALIRSNALLPFPCQTI